MLHTIFVFYPIDIYLLNSSNRIIAIYKDVKPFTPLLVPKNRIKYIIECASGTLKELKIGSHIEMFKNQAST